MINNLILTKEMINESNIFNKEQTEEFWEFIRKNGELIESKEEVTSKYFLLGSISCTKVLLFIGAWLIYNGLFIIISLSYQIYPFVGIVINLGVFFGLAYGGYYIYENVEFKQTGTVCFELSTIAIITAILGLFIYLESSSLLIPIIAFTSGSLYTYFLIYYFENIEFNVFTIIYQNILIILLFFQMSIWIKNIDWIYLNYIEIIYSLLVIWYVYIWDLKLGRQVDVVTLQYLMGALLLYLNSFYLNSYLQVVLSILLMLMTLVLFKFIFMIVGVIAMISAILRVLNELDFLTILNAGIVILIFGLFLIVFGYFYNAYNITRYIYDSASIYNIKNYLPEDELESNNKSNGASEV